VSDSSFDIFYRDTFGPLGGYALSLLGDPNTAEELTQEAMVRVYARWTLLRDPRPYAYRVVTNLARDRWRRRRHEVAALRDLVASPVAGPDGGVWTPSSGCLHT
jgi:RNA polymerase sigma-70 factor (ECF subfamily)